MNVARFSVISRAINSTIVRNNFILPLMRAATSVAAAIAPAWVARTAAQRFITPPHHAHTPPELRHLQNGRRVPIVTPIISPIAQPIRQCRVALAAMPLDTEP